VKGALWHGNSDAGHVDFNRLDILAEAAGLDYYNHNIDSSPEYYDA
jgi:biotin synthase-like enzyme